LVVLGGFFFERCFCFFPEFFKKKELLGQPWFFFFLCQTMYIIHIHVLFRNFLAYRAVHKRGHLSVEEFIFPCEIAVIHVTVILSELKS